MPPHTMTLPAGTVITSATPVMRSTAQGRQHALLRSGHKSDETHMPCCVDPKTALGLVLTSCAKQ